MPRLSWNEIQDRALAFAGRWEGETYEKGESQTFWGGFLDQFGIDRRRHGAFFEYAIKKGSGKQGFIDLFWPGKLLAEQKSGGKDTTNVQLAFGRPDRDPWGWSRVNRSVAMSPIAPATPPGSLRTPTVAALSRSVTSPAEPSRWSGG